MNGQSSWSSPSVESVIIEVDDIFDDNSDTKCLYTNQSSSDEQTPTSRHKGTVHVCAKCKKGFVQLQHLKTHKCPHKQVEIGQPAADSSIPTSKKTSNEQYSCKYCSRSFDKLFLLKYHQQVHTGRKPFGCNNCDIKFTTMASLFIHQKKFHSNNPYLCKKCAQSYLSLKKFRTHCCVVKIPFVCAGCGRGYMKFSSLKTHVQTCKGITGKLSDGHFEEYQYRWYKQSFACQHCKASFKQLTRFIEHQIKEHRTNTTISHQSKKTGAKQDLPQSVTSLCKADSPYVQKSRPVCNECGNSYQNMTNLRRHQQDKHSIFTNTYRCQHCSHFFATALTLRRHQHKMHPEHSNFNKASSFICTICNAVFTRQDLLFRHQKSYHLIPSRHHHMCDVCGKFIAGKGNLTRHQKCKHAINSSKRDDFNKIGRSDSNVHQMEKSVVSSRYCCDTCGKKYVKKHNLKKHKLAVHSTYKCRMCNRSYTSLSILRQHCTKKHKCASSKTQSMSTCKDYSTSTPTDQSKSALSADKICKICGERYGSLSCLERHQNMVYVAANDDTTVEDKVENQRFSCSICDKQYMSKGSLNRHLQTHH